MLLSESLLNNLGLGEKEKMVYNYILEYGKIAPAHISRLSKLNRTTVYSVGRELIEKGLVYEDLGGKTIYYLPAQSDALEQIIDLGKRKLLEQEKTIRELQSAIRNLPESKTFSVPKIRYVEEAFIEKYLHEATPRWITSNMTTDTTWWGFQDHTFAECFKDWIVWFWKQAPEEVNLKLFSNNSDVEKSMKQERIRRRQIRFWKGDNDFTGTQWIIGSYIVLIVTNQKPHYLVEIHDSVMAHNMREVFRELWNQKSA
jgi:sugar-specific transcriptional regulator TrmB